MKITQPQDWINVSSQQVRNKGGRTLLHHYNESLLKGSHHSNINYVAVGCIYPQQFDAHRSVLESAESAFAIKRVEDWVQIDQHQLQQCPETKQILSAYHSLPKGNISKCVNSEMGFVSLTSTFSNETWRKAEYTTSIEPVLS